MKVIVRKGGSLDLGILKSKPGSSEESVKLNLRKDQEFKLELFQPAYKTELDARSDLVPGIKVDGHYVALSKLKESGIYTNVEKIKLYSCECEITEITRGPVNKGVNEVSFVVVNDDGVKKVAHYKNNGEKAIIGYPRSLPSNFNDQTEIYVSSINHNLWDNERGYNLNIAEVEALV